MTTAVASIRERASGYELSSLAARDRGEFEQAALFTLLAITLFEVAEALELEAAA